jgi:hypothetical protein
MAHPDLMVLGGMPALLAGGAEGHAEVMAANVDLLEGRQGFPSRSKALCARVRRTGIWDSR